MVGRQGGESAEQRVAGILAVRRKICVVTSGRADYGLLYWPMREIINSKQLELQIIATGMHLSPEYGLTVNRIIEDGFDVSRRVDMLVSGDSATAVTKSMGLGVIGFADSYEALTPDIVLLLGDRFEILAAAQAALIARIPVAHLCGGDTTEGAFDESIRHGITKFSHLHFVSNVLSAKRVIQMGENPNNVHVVGSTGLDAIRQTTVLDRETFFEAINFKPKCKNILVTFHPVTLGPHSSQRDFSEVLSALDAFGDNMGIIFTRPNADTEGRVLNEMLEQFVKTHSNASAYVALGGLYLSGLKHVDAVVGNSSSGLYEAPSFGIPTINIGDRQKGRLQAESVINCESTAMQIIAALRQGFDKDFSGTVNPYGDGYASQRIVETIEEIGDWNMLLQKQFYLLDGF